MFISSTSVPVGKFVAKTLVQDLKEQEHAFCPKANSSCFKWPNCLKKSVFCVQLESSYINAI